jgi:zinc protease
MKKMFMNLNRTLRAVCMLCGVASVMSCGLQSGAPEIFPAQLTKEIPQLPEFPIEEFELQNGLHVLFREDRELPLVDVRLYIPGGSLWEDPMLPGVFSAMGDQMREGGSGSLSPDALDEFLEDRAASLSSAVGDEYGEFGVNSLAEDFPEVFRVFAGMLLQPRFDESRLSLWKTQSLEGIRRRSDDPSTIAGLTLRRLLYGESPYGKILNADNIEDIQRIDLLRLHREYVRPEQALLVVHGAISRTEIENLINIHLSAWENRHTTALAAPEINHTPQPGIYFVARPLQQATITIGQLGAQRLSDDYLDIAVFNEIFGSGGFGSLLMDRVREELGLAYSVYGAILPAVKQGMNLIGLQTKTDSAAQAIEESLAILQRTQTQVVPEHSLQEAKDGIIQSQVFDFDSGFKILKRQAYLRLLHYPKDYDQSYLPGIRNVNAEDILRTSKRRWDINKLVIVVVGDPLAREALLQKTRLPQKESLLSGMKLVDAQFTNEPLIPE